MFTAALRGGLFAADRRWFPSRRSRFFQQQSSFLPHSATRSMMSRKLLVDVDCGVDDAQAIMLALAAPNVELLGVTCVHGNTSLENVCKNTLRVLQACSRLEIPVFKGSAKPILGECIDAGDFHGKDGLGDAPDPNAPGLDLLQKEGAVSAIIRIVNENPGEVTLVATAPLTNLALAVKMDPSLPNKLRGLWLAQDTDKARFMARIFQHSINASQSERLQELVAGTGFISCDSYAMAAAVDESFITESDHYPVTVELTGTHTRGMMVVDTVGFLKKAHKAHIMKKVDLEKFKQMMMAALK